MSINLKYYDYFWWISYPPATFQVYLFALCLVLEWLNSRTRQSVKRFFSEPGFKSTGKASAIWSKLCGEALLFIGHDIMQLASWSVSAGCHDSQCHWHLVGTETRSSTMQEEMKRKNDKRTRNVKNAYPECEADILYQFGHSQCTMC